MSHSLAERKITIVDINLAAIPIVARLSRAGGGEPWSPAFISQILSIPGSFGVLAENRGKPIGFILARVVADESEVINLVVLPEGRQQGIGGLLLDVAIARSREGGAKSMFLEVASDNARARRLYNCRGFTQVGTRPDYYRSGTVNYTDADILRLDLIKAVNDQC